MTYPSTLPASYKSGDAGYSTGGNAAPDPNSFVTVATVAQIVAQAVAAAGGGSSGTPADGSVTTAKIAPAGLAQSAIAGLVAALAGKATQADINTAVTSLVNGAPGILDTLGEIATQLQSDESAAVALTNLVNGKLSITDAAATYSPKLTPTATKVATYAVAAGEMAMMNVAGGATSLTLPSAPPNKTIVGYRAIGATAKIPLTITCGGTDTLGTSGATSTTAPIDGDVGYLQYDATSTRWLSAGPNKPQAGLDAYNALLFDAITPDLRAGVASKRMSVLRERNFQVAPDVLHPDAAAVVAGITFTNQFGTTLTNGQQIFTASSLAGKDSTINLLGADTLVQDGTSGYYRADWLNPNVATFGSSANVPPTIVETSTDAANLNLSVRGSGLAVELYQIFIDGQPVTDMPVATNTVTSSSWIINIPIPTGLAGKMRRVKVLLWGISLRAIFIDQWASAVAPRKRGPRVFFMGDSFLRIGYGDGSGNGVLGNWSTFAARELGWDDAWNGGLGSTGFVANGTSPRVNYRTRIGTDLIPANPDVVCLFSYFNDKATSVSDADLATAVGNCIDDIVAGVTPRPVIIVFGGHNQTSPYGELTATDAAVQAACQARSVPYVAPSSGKVWDGAGNLVATLGGWTNSNNAQRSVTLGAATPGTVTYAEPHGLSIGEQVVFNSLPTGTGLTTNTNFFVQTIVSPTVVNIATTQLGGSAVAISGSGGAGTVAGMVGQGSGAIHPSARSQRYMARKFVQSVRKLLPA